jgi:hypothetical protein
MSGRGKVGIVGAAARRIPVVELEHSSDEEQPEVVSPSMSPERQEIRKLWSQIENYWEREDPTALKTFGKPVTENSFSRCEDLCGFPLPEDFKEFYRVHNGQKPWKMESCNDFRALFGDSGVVLHDLSKCINETKLHLEPNEEHHSFPEYHETMIQMELKRDSSLEHDFPEVVKRKRELEQYNKQSRALNRQRITEPELVSGTY